MLAMGVTAAMLPPGKREIQTQPHAATLILPLQTSVGNGFCQRCRHCRLAQERYQPPNVLGQSHGSGEFWAICSKPAISGKTADCDGSIDYDPYSAPIRDGERKQSAAIG